MDDMNDTIALSFSDILDAAPAKASLEDLNKVVSEAVEQKFAAINKSPDDFIQVVDEGYVKWLTVRETTTYLQELLSLTSTDFHQKAQSALKCSTQQLLQEIRILLALSYGTLDNFLAEDILPASEIDRVRPQILRIGRQAFFLINQIMDLENKINKTRQESGVISNFETKMAELLQMQKEGKQEEAFVLAKELAMLKRKYINHSRGIRADAVRTKTLRHEYHLHKKTILNLQRYLHTQRESAIKERLESIRKRLSITKYQLERGDPNKREQFEKQLSLQEEKINNNTVILTMVRKQLGVLKKQEQILDNVIQHIHDQVEEVKSGKQAKPQEPQTETSPKKSEEDIPTMSEDQNKKSKRMVMRKYQDS